MRLAYPSLSVGEGTRGDCDLRFGLATGSGFGKMRSGRSGIVYRDRLGCDC